MSKYISTKRSAKIVSRKKSTKRVSRKKSAKRYVKRVSRKKSAKRSAKRVSRKKSAKRSVKRISRKKKLSGRERERLSQQKHGEWLAKRRKAGSKRIQEFWKLHPEEAEAIRLIQNSN